MGNRIENIDQFEITIIAIDFKTLLADSSVTHKTKVF